MNRRLCLAIAVVATAILSSPAESYGQAAPTNAVKTGNWFAADTWSAGVPTDSVPAAINGGFEVTVDQDGGLTNVVDVGSIPGETGNLNFTAGLFDLIDSDPVAEPNATVLRLGQAAGSTGNMTMSGGDIAISEDITDVFDSGDLVIGQSGTGTLTMTGGKIKAGDELIMGQNAGSSGTLNISGGEIRVDRRNMQVGFGAATDTLPGGHAELNISGTANISIAGWMFTSFDPGTTSVITQTGGNVEMAGLLVHGTRGDATFNQSGGNLKADLLIVGDNFEGPGVHSTYNISGTAKLESRLVLWVGAWGGAEGTVNQDGGTVEPGALTVGRDGMGAYNMNSGVLNIKGTDGYFGNNHLIVGQVGNADENISKGTGVFTQTGGTVTVPTGVFLGDYDNSEGTYKISGGTLNVNGTGTHPDPNPDAVPFIGDFSVGGALASNAVISRVEPDGSNGPQGQALNAHGTFIVSGSAATINIAGDFLANPADKSSFRSDPFAPGGNNSATLGFEIFDGTGTSLINVGGVADLDGAVIDLDLMSGFTPASGTVFDLLKASSFGATGAGTTQNVGTGEGFALASEDAGAWSLAVVAGSGFETLKATFLGVVAKPGDFNNDGYVDGTDFLTWQKGVGIAAGATKAQGDANGDGAVNAADLGLWKADFGSQPAVAAVGAVPEPGTAALMLVAAIAAAGASRTATRSGRRAA